MDVLLRGSINQLSCAPFFSHTFIFSFKASISSVLEHTSITKSGQTGANLSRSSIVRLFHFANDIHEASGDRTDRSESVKPVEESKTRPRPSFLLQSPSCPNISELCRPDNVL